MLTVEPPVEITTDVADVSLSFDDSGEDIDDDDTVVLTGEHAVPITSSCDDDAKDPAINVDTAAMCFNYDSDD